MSIEKEIFNRLLPVDDLYYLYRKLGDSLLNNIDLRNVSFDQTAVKNSLSLLISLGLIIKSTAGLYEKGDNEVNSIDDFSKIVLAGIEKSVLSKGDIFSESNMVFDPEKATFYIPRNNIPLDLSGLIMLLDGLGRLRLTDNRAYIINDNLVELHRQALGKKKLNKPITIQELKDKLSIQDELGEAAEFAALEFERQILNDKNIAKEPIRISDIDTTAGYDIASFLSNSSESTDKFIEVKSCSDDRYSFFISRNEIDTAKIYGKQYYLYLFNRKSSTFQIINDPYNEVFSSDKWSVNPQLFRVSRRGDS